VLDSLVQRDEPHQFGVAFGEWRLPRIRANPVDGHPGVVVAGLQPVDPVVGLLGDEVDVLGQRPVPGPVRAR